MKIENCHYTLTLSHLDRDRYLQEQNGTGIGINETVVYFNGNVNGNLLHYYLINFVVNSHFKMHVC